MKTLLIGGARSGKSAWAERLARQWCAAAPGREVWVFVTGQAGDAEMAARIAAHQAQRPPEWRVVEAPTLLARALQAADAPHRLLLVDCLTLWVSNLLLADGWQDGAEGATPALPPEAGPAFLSQRAALLALLPRLQGPVVLVGNEVGHGIVPMGAMNRLFVDENGRLHQALAQHCDEVRWVMAGCGLALKGG